ncbi:RNA-binding protein 42-like [Physella acuta]|uniref:RNA-binding protein 42-like n=1 Tax=Physella acuta TaxID=109671 RepID=UPI0027DCEC29|nr:RNA-binding protein 42-like [Physella acuta]
MASISKERLREMEEEMDRFEAEIQVPGGPPPPGRGFILGANTYDRVQAQLSSLRQESTRLQQQQMGRVEDDDNDEDLEDEDLRMQDNDYGVGHKRGYPDDEEDNEYYDIDERPGRPQGPLIPPPPPPPIIPHRHPPSHAPQMMGDMSLANMFAPPPPPPPEPEDGEEVSTLSFKPYAPGEGPCVPRPAFMPPQLRQRLPPPNARPPFPRPPMRMGGPYGGPMGPPRHMMGPGPNMGQMGPGMMGPQGHMGPPGPPMGMPGGQPRPPGLEGSMPFMGPIDPPQIIRKPAVIEQPKLVYSAAPVINIDRKTEGKKKKKKKGKSETDATDSKAKDPVSSNSTSQPSHTTAEEEKPPAAVEAVPDPPMMTGMMGGINLNPAVPGNVPGNPANPTGKKEKKKKEKKFIRLAANTTWEDPTLAEWQQDDFRMFCGDLGNEVTDETLVRAFNKYPSFLKAKVVRDRRTNKTKGYGFVSFKDPVDFTRAMREMNGKYVGNRPIKLRKSNWKDRNIEVVRKKDKEKKRLGLK